MDTAADLFREALAAADMNSPEIKVLSNYTGDFHDGDVDGIKDRLYNQLKHPVMWNDNLVNAFAAGIDKIYEFGGGIGPGEPEEKRPNLEGMIKKASRAAGSEAVYVPVINEATIEAAVA
jgi:[acyl-carrier-protein] S-malonyltransferase